MGGAGDKSTTSSIDFPFLKGCTALVDAIISQEPDMVDTLLDSGADVNLANRQGLAPLHAAALVDNGALIKRLVTMGAIVDQVDRLGNTAVHLAFAMARLNATAALSQLGASTTIANASGITAQDIARTPSLGDSDFAAQYSAIVKEAEADIYLGVGRTILFDTVFGATDTTFVQLLLNAGADPNSSTRIGVTPLHVAAFRDREDMARLLVKHGAQPSAVDARGNTPLHVACALGNMALASALVQLGADKTKRDARGKTPFQLVLASDGARLRADYANAD
ncbi:ankyrin repeat protein [Pandoravirus inopinatum]|uniref:Ankyrin repeat protein n=1 Tax=Pandoravirus inopinatum TaxID=1605721 RepID=A0A0B5J9F5_9VIRU|nr:ankyrin repeat protein [Pandoravirus inopinatum]AJF97506.1 ankyrin repeat protein [Pandoravirus inopinatum]